MDFWSGLAQGTANLPDEIGKLQELARARKAAAALANSDFSGVGAPQGQPQPPPAAPSPPPPPPAAALAALAQRPPAPPAAPNPGSRFPVVPGQPDPLGALPPQGQPQGQPAQPQPAPQPDPNLSATAQPGVNFDNPIREANQTWQSIIGSIKKANPKIDPLTLVQAAKDQLENIKGVAPLTKSIMDAQIKGQEFMLTAQMKMQRIQQLGEEVQIKLMNARTAQERNQILSDWHTQMAAIESQRADTYQQATDFAHQDRQDATSARKDIATQTNQTRRDTTDARDETQEDIQGGRSSDSKYRSDQGLRGANVRSGAPAGPAPDGSRLGLPPDARKAPDGHYYARRRGRYVRFD